jgi:DNA polymerase III subunit delta
VNNPIEKLQAEWSEGKFAPAYLFYGEEEYLIQQYIQMLQEKCLEPGSEDFNLDLLYASDLDGAALVNAAASFPVMAARRMVIIKNIQDLSVSCQKVLAHYLKSPAASTCLVLTAIKFDSRKGQFSAIKSRCTVVEAKPLYDNQVEQWIKSLVAKRSMSISEEALRLLHSCTGNGLRAIASELEKIELNLGDKKKIELADVENIVGISKQYSIFELCDSVGAKNLKNSLDILSHMLQLGEQPTLVISMLTRHYLILAKAKALQVKRANDQEIAKEIKVNPFFIRNYLQQSALYSNEQLENVFHFLLEADLHLKTSYQKPRLVLETLLFNIQTL